MRKKNNKKSITVGPVAANAKLTRLRGRAGLAMLMAATVGLTGCQTFGFPGNPFAGGRLPVAKLPLPKLPSFAKLPKPNFGNIARAVRTPSEQVVAPNSPSIASAKRQPPPPPSRKFDSTATDQQLAQSEKVSGGSGTKFAATSDAGTAAGGDFQPDARRSAGNTDVALTDAQKRFKDALSGKLASNADKTTGPSTAAGLWGDYRPDPTIATPGSPSIETVQDLAKVNRNLYDQYGKLSTGSSSSKLSEPLDAKMLAAKISQKEIDKTNQSVANLKRELERIKTRGSGNSDDFSLPPRSALEIAGTAPPAPRQDEPETPVYKGFGTQVALSPIRENSDLADQGPVRIAHSKAHVNVLRATPRQIPGLVPTIEIEGSSKYAATQFGGYGNKDANTADAGNAQSEALAAAQPPSSRSDFQASQFVEKMNDQEIPLLTATPTSKTFEMPLPREVSEASLAAIRENELAAAQAPMPQVTLQNPIQHTPVAMTPRQTTVATAVEVLPQSPTVQAPQSTAAAFQIPTTQFRRVVNNPFYRPSNNTIDQATVESSEVRVADANSDAMANPEAPAGAEQRTTDLPRSLMTDDNAYAPGSVVRPQTDTSILR